MGKNMSDSRGQKDKKGKPLRPMNISCTLLLSSIVCNRYLCSKVVSTLGSDGMRLDVKPIQVLRTMIVACLICVSNSVDLVAVKSILAKLCAEIEQSMFSKGRHKAHEGFDFPEFQLGRWRANIPEKFRAKGLSNDYRNLKMTVTVKIEDDDSKRVWSVLYLMEKKGYLKKYLGQHVKILGMGLSGLKPEEYDSQCK